MKQIFECQAVVVEKQTALNQRTLHGGLKRMVNEIGVCY